MHPAKVEYCLIYPSLKKLFENCDKKDGYWTYMSEMYDTVRFVRSCCV